MASPADSSFQIGRNRIEVSLDEDNRGLKIRCLEGSLVVIPKLSNVILVRTEPFWSRDDTVRVVAHAGKIGPVRAARIVDTLRGHGA